MIKNENLFQSQVMIETIENVQLKRTFSVSDAQKSFHNEF